MKRPWIPVLGTVLVLLVALSWALKRSDWLSDRLLVPVEQGLRQASGRSINVAGVGAGLSGWIWLHGVAVGPAKGERALDISLTAQAVGLKLDFWDLLRGKVDIGSLRAIQVESPRLYLLRRETVQPSAVSPTVSIQDWQARLRDLPLPPVTMQLNDGQVWDQPLGRPARLAALDVALHVDPRQDQGLRLSGQGRLPGGGTLAAWGHSGPDWQGVELSLRAQDMELGRLNLLPAPLSISAGTFSGELAIQPAPGAWPDGLGLHGEGQLKGVDAGQPGRPGIQALGAQWRLQAGRLELSGLSAQAWAGRLRGQGRLDLANLALSATVEAEDASLAGLALSAGAPGDLGLDGRAHMQIGLMGPVTSPAFTAGLQVANATWQGHALSGIDLALRIQAGEAEAHGSLAWDGGRGDLDLDAQDGGLRSLRFKAEALPADWFKAWAKTDLQGRLDGEVEYHRAPGGGLGPWQVQLRAPKVSLGGRELAKAVLEAQGDGQSARLRLDSDLPQWPQLGLQADAQRQKDGTWNLRNAKLNQHGRLLAGMHGSWKPGLSSTAGTLQLAFHSSLVPVAQLPGWPGFQSLSGSVQADGEVAFDGAWRGSLEASSPNLAGPGGPLPAQAAMNFGPEGVSVTSLVLRRGEWSGQAWAPAWDGPWQGKLQAVDAALAPLAGLSPAQAWGLSGSANGSLEFDAAQGAVQARLTLSDPWPAVLAGATVALDLAVDDGHMQLRSLKLSQPTGGTLAGQADWDITGRRTWKGEARWLNLAVGEAHSSGRLRLDGGGGADGRALLDPWDLDGQALPALEALLSFAEGRPEALQVQAGHDLGLAVRREDGRWKGRATLTAADPGPWLGFWLGQAHATPLRLNGWAEAGPYVHGQPLALRGHLDDLAEPGSGLDWQGQWLSGQGPAGTASWRGLDLARVGEALRALGLSAPSLKGSVQGRLNGGAQGLSCSGQVQGLEARDMAFGGAAFSGGWSPGHVWLDEFKTDGSEPSLQVEKASWRRDTGGWSAQADLKAQALSLAIFDLDLDAHVQVHQREAGLDAQVLAHDLAIGVRHWKELALDGTWGQGTWTLKQHGRDPSFQAHGGLANGAFSMDIDGRSGGGKGNLNGTVGPKGALHLLGQSQGMDAADLAGIMGWDQDWHGSTWGSLAVTGDTDQAHTLVDAKIEDGSVGGLPFDLATGLVRQDGDWVDLAPVSPIRLSRKNGVALEVTGKVPLGSSTAEGVDVRAELKQGGLGLFAGLPGIATADGPLELKLRFHGRRDDPQVDGLLRVTHGRIGPAWMLPQLEKVELMAQMTNGRVELQQARGQVAGDGPLVRVEVADPRRPAFVFERWEPSQFNLRLRSSAGGLPVRSNQALQFVDGTVIPDLAFSGSWDAPVLSGSVTLVKGDYAGGSLHFSDRSVLPGLLLGDKASVTWPAVFNPPAKEGEAGFSDRLALNLRLIARKDVLVRTDAAQVFVDTGPDGLLVSGPPDARVLQGKLTMTKGSIDYFLASFTLASDHDSSIEMHGADAPVLDLWGVKDVTGAYLQGDSTPRDVEVRLHAFGPLGQVQMRLESDAADLSQSQLASLTGLGADPSDPRNQGGFARLLGSVGAGMFTRWARSTGLVDEVGLQLPFVDNYLGAQTTPGAEENVGGNLVQAAPLTATAQKLVEVSVGKYFGEKWFLGVNGEMDQHPSANNSSVQTGAVGGKLEYQLPNHARLSVESNVDATGVQDQRVMLQKSARLDNYNPQQRRWDLDGADQPPASPTPSPAPAPSPSPSPGPEPAKAP